MKIAFVTAFPEDPAAPKGGVEAVSVTLLDALLRLGDLEITIVTTGRVDALAKSTWQGAAVHRLPRRGRWTLTDAIGPGRRQMQEHLRALAPDLVHANDTYGLMVEGLPLPRVFTIHGFIHADTIVAAKAWARPRAAIWSWFERKGWADQPHIISISPYVRERLQGVARGVIHDIENPVRREFFGVERRDTGVVLSAGAICQRKNTLGLVKAFARVAAQRVDATLRLVGHAPEPEYLATLQRYVGEHGLERRVQLAGSLAQPQMVRELEAASVFALLSLEENSPLGIQEAMACGVPVLTSNRCGMPYLVKDGETGFLVDPLNTDEIAARLRELLEDAALRRAQGERAAAAARARFHPDYIARRTREVYVRVASSAPLRAVTVAS
jgi:glycosyltransferase involved in cell wall biosynthesis